ncbi:uncharacterized protein LOC110985640 isoform X3 [Acanthaster planci]|uniref:Uncharacterized protein LOC110985640 isoform X3 n=1 Tax=Acanthaster planci TaxID=133434 RepID=A0A8B7ZC02_ACAPL|nr:uncharacterized protein LOC110985640 isoform X3 [Acanthaster planci]
MEMLNKQATVAAHNANVYNPGREPAQKRKREKAQDQLRNRMRKRNNGASTSVVSARSFGSQREKGESAIVAGIKPRVWGDVKHNSTSEEWRSHEARYSTLAQPDRMIRDKRHRQGEVPLTELVDRVIQRRGHTTVQSSPMTIRALKPPAFQHRGLIRKIQPVSIKQKPTSGGPYVVVLNRSSTTKASGSTGIREPKDLPPLKHDNNSSDLEIATWRPELSTNHEPYVHPNAEDRSVTNYRLQMQQAIKMAELRCDFSTSSKPLHKHEPLPAIQVAYEVAEKPQVAMNSAAGDEAEAAIDKKEPMAPKLQGHNVKSIQNEFLGKTNRFTSSQEVLQQMQARKRAKRRKAKGDDFNNPLRTRNRFTTKTKLFKADLQKVRELSIIQEDQSSISDRLSRLSAGRTSVASFKSMASLKRIEESEIPGYTGCSLSSEQEDSGITEIEHAETNADAPSILDDEGEHLNADMSDESETPASSADTDPADEISSPLGPDVNVINTSTDCFACDSVEQTTEGLNDAQEPVVDTAPSSPGGRSQSLPQPESQTLSETRTDDSSTSSTLIQGNCTDPAVQCTCTNSSDPSEETATSRDPGVHELHVSHTYSSYEEDAEATKESTLAGNQQSNDVDVEGSDHPQGITANTFQMRDIILPVQ